MSATANPNGFRPVQRLDGLPYAGATRLYPIASNTTAGIFYGDIVSLNSSGVLIKGTAGAGATISAVTGAIGIFVGVTYTDPGTKQKVFRQNYPGAIVASDIQGYVVDDPNVVFRAQADGALAQTNLANNIGIIDTAGDTATGNSKIALASATAAAGVGAVALPFRIVGFVNAPGSVIGDAFTDVLVTFTFGQHLFQQAEGI